MVVGGSLRSELGGEWGQARESRSLGWGRGTAEVVLKGQHFLLRREPRVHAPAQDRKRAVWNIAQHRVVSGTGGGVCIIGGGGCQSDGVWDRRWQGWGSGPPGSFSGHLGNKKSV